MIGYYYLGTFPDGIRQRFIDNFIRLRSDMTWGEYCSLEFGSLYAFVVSAFDWAHAFEDGEFWDRVACGEYSHTTFVPSSDEPIGTDNVTVVKEPEWKITPFTLK